MMMPSAFSGSLCKYSIGQPLIFPKWDICGRNRHSVIERSENLLDAPEGSTKPNRTTAPQSACMPRWRRTSLKSPCTRGKKPYTAGLLGDLLSESGRSEDAAVEYRQMVEEDRQAAEKGYDWAEVHLAWAYDTGKGVDRDQVEAVKWYRQAADKGNSAAQASLGRNYENGGVVPFDPVEAVKWYRLAAKQGDINAQQRLGAMYYNGLGIPMDRVEGLKWYRKFIQESRALVARGDIGVANQLAWLLVTSDVSELRDGPGAVILAGQAVTATNGNDPLILQTLAAAYAEDGQFDKAISVAKDAIAHLTVKQGSWRQDMEFRLKLYQSNSPYRFHDLGSLDHLAYAYEIGDGVEQNADEAIKRYRLAASEGYALSQASLGRMYRDGIGVPQDAAEAVKWYRLAADQGNAGAQRRLAAMYTFGLGIQRDSAEGSKWYHKLIERAPAAAAAGDVDLLNEIAWLLATSDVPELRNGRGAVTLIELAVAATNRRDANNLDTLAAAYAENGQFAKAVAAEKEAISALHQPRLREEMETALKLYESNSPYRDHELLSLDQWAITHKDHARLANSEALFQQQLGDVRARSPVDDRELADLLSRLTLTLLVDEKFTDAEPLAHECLEILERKIPDDWQTFNARSMFGGSFLGQGNYTDAEPLLLAGCEGMIRRINFIPAIAKPRMRESIQRLIQFYQATKQSEKAAEWDTKLTSFENLDLEHKVAATKP
jgi:uncharacterized protein